MNGSPQAFFHGESGSMYGVRTPQVFNQAPIAWAMNAGPWELEAFVEPGQGQAVVAAMADLLRGVGFCGYLMFEWPKLWMASLPEPQAVLPKLQAYLSALLSARHPVLSA